MIRRKAKPFADREKTVHNQTRRSLLNGLWLALGGLALAEVAWLVGSFLKPQKTRTSSDLSAPIIDAGPSDRYAPGTVTASSSGSFLPGMPGRWGLHGAVPALHPPGLHGALGPEKKAVRLPLPRIGVRHPRRGDPVPGPTATGPVCRLYREQADHGRHQRNDPKKFV